MTHRKQDNISKPTESFLSLPLPHGTPPSCAQRGAQVFQELLTPARIAEAQQSCSGLKGGQSRVFSSSALGSEPNLYFAADLLYPAVSFGYLL